MKKCAPTIAVVLGTARVVLAAALPLAQADMAWAQEALTRPADGLSLDEVVVTATPEARSRMRQSLSVSALSGEQLTDSGASSVADALRLVPGVRAEASSGEGNANVTVRGVPISAGGSRYLQFQEDGLPVLLFGDVNFVTPDMFMRLDPGTDGLEVVRGGSASTLASQAAGGVVNVLSKTAADLPGSLLEVTASLAGGRSRRLAFAHAIPSPDGGGVLLSGFLRDGEGPRPTHGARMEQGGQLRLVLTRAMGGGDSARLFVKLLDDQTPTQLTVPVRIVQGRIQRLQGVDPRDFSPYARGLPGISPFGLSGGKPADINDGLRARSVAVGGQLDLTLGGGWVLSEKFRVARNAGAFNGLMPGSYASGANPDSTAPAGYNALYLGARFNDVGLAVNDVRATRTEVLGEGRTLSATVGLFLARQKLDLDWEIGGFSSPLPVDGGTSYGSYSSSYRRALDLRHDAVAPYLAAGLAWGPWNLDASLRQDHQHVTGSFQDNGDGLGVGVQAVDHRSKLDAHSLGLNRLLSRDLAVFVRTSRGGALPSDRILFPSSAALALCGNHCFVGARPEPNRVVQHEGGVKFRQGAFSAFVTLFMASTRESNHDFTTGVSSVNRYEARGVEIESAYRLGQFRIQGGLTLTDAEVKGSNNPAYLGKAPNRQARAVFQLAPSCHWGATTVGATVVGTGRSRDAQTTALEAELPAYVAVNAFVRHAVSASTTLTLAANNLFNRLGYTEVNSERAAARSINGRTVSLALRHSF